MSNADWLVLLGGILAIGWVNWYFFVAPRRRRGIVVDGREGSGPQEVEIVVRGGYQPSTVRVRHGKPVRLVFNRQETSSCSEEVVLPDFGIRRYLPAGERTVIEVTPRESRTYEFACGMGMLRGRLIAE